MCHSVFFLNGTSRVVRRRFVGNDGALSVKWVDDDGLRDRTTMTLMARVNDDCADIIAEYAVADVRTALALRATSRRWHGRVVLRILALLAVDQPDLSPYSPDAVGSDDAPAVLVGFSETGLTTDANHALRVALSTDAYGPRIQRLLCITACDAGLAIDELTLDVFRPAAFRFEGLLAMNSGVARRVAGATRSVVLDVAASDGMLVACELLPWTSERLRRLEIPRARDAMKVLASVPHPEAVTTSRLGRHMDEEEASPPQAGPRDDVACRNGSRFTNLTELSLEGPEWMHPTAFVVAAIVASAATLRCFHYPTLDLRATSNEDRRALGEALCATTALADADDALLRRCLLRSDHDGGGTAVARRVDSVTFRSSRWRPERLARYSPALRCARHLIFRGVDVAAGRVPPMPCLQQVFITHHSVESDDESQSDAESNVADARVNAQPIPAGVVDLADVFPAAERVELFAFNPALVLDGIRISGMQCLKSLTVGFLRDGLCITQVFAGGGAGLRELRSLEELVLFDDDVSFDDVLSCELPPSLRRLSAPMAHSNVAFRSDGSERIRAFFEALPNLEDLAVAQLSLPMAAAPRTLRVLAVDDLTLEDAMALSRRCLQLRSIEVHSLAMEDLPTAWLCSTARHIACIRGGAPRGLEDVNDLWVWEGRGAVGCPLWTLWRRSFAPRV